MLKIQRLRALFLCAIAFLIVGCGGGSSISATQAEAQTKKQPFSLLWNPGPTWHATVPMDGNALGACDEPALVDMSEAWHVGNPLANQSLYCVGSAAPANPGGYAPSYFNNTGWAPEQFGKSPGWSVTDTGGAGAPITFTITNDSAALADPCWLAEVSASYIGWRDLSLYPGYPNTLASKNATVFKELYDPGSFASITGTFSAKLDDVPTPSNCSAAPTNQIESDFAIQYFDADGKLLRQDLIGVTVFTMYHPKDVIWYSSGCLAVNGSCAQPHYVCLQTDNECQMILDGVALGFPALTDQFQTYNIDFLLLLKQYFPEQPAGTASAWVIVDEVYSTARGATSKFDVTNMDLIGVPAS